MIKFLKNFRIIKTLRVKIESFYWIQEIIYNIYKKRLSKLKYNRYRNLFRIIKEQKSHNFIEIGVFDGATAFKMIRSSKKFHPKNKIEYFGFDLFEEISKNEIVKEHSKKPLTFNFIKNMLEKTGAHIHLFKGNTKETLPIFNNDEKDKYIQFDFILIDGGHSIETISSDWNNIKNLLNENTIVVFDDYYTIENKELKGVGCNSIVHGLDKNIYDIKMLYPADTFKAKGIKGKNNMIKVQLK